MDFVFIFCYSMCILLVSLVLPLILCLLSFLFHAFRLKYLLSSQVSSNFNTLPPIETNAVIHFILGHQRILSPLSNPVHTSNLLTSHASLNSNFSTTDILQFYDYLNEPRLLIISKEALNQVMIQFNSNYVKPDLMRKVFGRILGPNGLLLLENAQHASVKRLIRPAFSYEMLLEYSRVFFKTSFDTLDELFQSKCGENVNVAEIMNEITLKVICIAGFGCDSDDYLSLKILMHWYLKVLEGRELEHWIIIAFLIIPDKFLRYLPFPRLQKILHDIEQIKSIIYDILSSKSTSNASTSIFQLLMAHQQQSSTHDEFEFKPKVNHKNPTFQLNFDINILDNALTFIAAGHSTTKEALCWSSFVVAGNPKIQINFRRTFETLESQLRTDCPEGGKVSSRKLMQALDADEHLNAFVCEVLRLYSPITLVARKCTRDHVVCGVHVPKGCVVSIPILAIHRSVRYWGENAMEFDGNRFVNLKSNHSDGYLPFLRGPRSCIASRFAVLEIKAILFTLIRTFHMEIQPGCEPKMSGTISSIDGLSLKFKKTQKPALAFVK